MCSCLSRIEWTWKKNTSKILRNMEHSCIKQFARRIQYQYINQFLIIAYLTTNNISININIGCNEGKEQKKKKSHLDFGLKFYAWFILNNIKLMEIWKQDSIFSYLPQKFRPKMPGFNGRVDEAINFFWNDHWISKTKLLEELLKINVSLAAPFAELQYYRWHFEK